MSPVLDAKALQASPLADLHLLANELGVDGYRRLRKADLVAAILEHQGGEAVPADDEAPAVEEVPAAEEASGAEEVPSADEAAADVAEPAEGAAAEDEEERREPEGEVEEEERERRGRRGRRGGRGRGRARDEEAAPAERSAEADDAEATVEGVVELQSNGSGFLRVSPPEPSDDDVYISAAQVKRCELVAGDRVSGPVRRPRNSERHPSLVRVDRINGSPADEVVESVRFEDRPARFPDERLVLGVEDPTVRAIEWLTPFGRGSRVTIAGPARAGKTEALRRVAGAIAAQGGVELILVLAGARPEETGEWDANGLPAPVAVAPLGSSPEVQAQAVELAIEQGRRVAARGGDAVLVIDSLAQLPVPAARRALATARKLVDGGSLTVIATAPEPLGGETTVIELDVTLTSLGRFPALDLSRSGSMRPDLLVGDEGAEAITKAKADALT